MIRRLSAVILLAAGLGAPVAAGADSGKASGTVAFRFQDPAIVESSGLVVVDGLVVTTNDSGDSGRVFTVDPATGRTVGVTHWADAPHDVEGLAPAGGGAVWVGDIGDNTVSRDSLQVARIPVGRGERTVHPTVFDLRYPDGPHNAETLVAAPDGRLYVATKDVAGGTLYAAPATLGAGENELTEVGRVIAIATDGAFTPDGRLLVIRNYFGAAVYRWPSLERVADLELPAEQQGEGLAVAPDDTVWLSSEGLHSPVLRITPWFAPSARGSESPSAYPSQGSPTASPARPPSNGAPVPWLVGAGAAVVVGLLLWLSRRRA